ncbi:hypothetical protein FA13DRAFT_1736258 [Coprinellus micaceus]|uniref:Uncharacterized protein n=1 Tax=Coprinellus micaceus TaxID=71717 RepID=A0A4Y7T0U8_COPMI|nr:hypothetical protein FA13DRAFT_1736258 [Coprinellus micaceus]
MSPKCHPNAKWSDERTSKAPTNGTLTVKLNAADLGLLEPRRHAVTKSSPKRAETQPTPPSNPSSATDCALLAKG